MRDACREARRRGKWVHMGRVNGLRRLRIALDFGVDTVDGTSLTRPGKGVPGPPARCHRLAPPTSRRPPTRGHASGPGAARRGR